MFPGYLFVGIAFGLHAQAASPLQVILMTLAANLRHLFYGFSFLLEFGERRVRRLYLTFSLTDEANGLLYQKKLKNKANRSGCIFGLCFWISCMYFWIMFLD